jgi:MFS family permease
MSVLPIFGIVSALLSGWILARVIHRRLMCAIAAILFSMLLPWVSILKTEYLIPLMATIGFSSSMVPAVMMAVLADLSQIRKSGSAPQALVNMGQNAGVLLGPILFGAMTEIAGGWSMAYWLLLPIGLIGAGAVLILRWRFHVQLRAGTMPLGTP